MIDLLGLPRGADGFLLQENQYESPFSTEIPGLYCAGGITGPKTIEETLNEARAVATEIHGFLMDSVSFAEKERIVIGL